MDEEKSLMIIVPFESGTRTENSFLVSFADFTVIFSKLFGFVAHSWNSSEVVICFSTDSCRLACAAILFIITPTSTQ